MENNTASSQNWPGGFGIYRTSKEAVLRNLSTIIWLIVLGFVGGMVIGLLFRRVFILQEIVAIALGLYLQVAYILVYLSGVRGKRLELDEVLKQAWPFTLYMIALVLMLYVTAVVTFVLLIVPFFIVMPRLSLAPYLLIDKKVNPGEAFKQSWELTRGNVGKVWGIIGVSLLMILPVITIVGILLTIYLLIMYSAAYAVLYVYLSGNQPKATETSPVPAEPKSASR
jgi:hypothetical protein